MEKKLTLIRILVNDYLTTDFFNYKKTTKYV